MAFLSQEDRISHIAHSCGSKGAIVAQGSWDRNRSEHSEGIIQET